MNCSDETLRQSSAASGNSPLASPNHSNNNSSNSNNSNSHGNQTVKVLVRARPGCDGTSAEHDIRVDEASSTVTFPRDKKGQAQFAFSKVLGPDADQATVYAQCEVVRDVIDGYNCCVMAYGQTGSGKTHTMYGVGWEGTQALTATAADAGLSLGRSMTFPLVPSADDEANPALPTVAPAARDSTLASTEESAGKDELSPWNAPQTVEESTLLGVVPRSISDLFVLLDERAGDNSKKFEYSIHCQVMQIYNEKIYDLLQDKRRENPLQLRDSSTNMNSGINGGFDNTNETVHVRGMSVFRVYSKEDAFQLLRKGLRNRVVRSTEFNSESSRSHTIVQLFLSLEEEDDDGGRIIKRSTFSLVDLAGSEKWRESLSLPGTSMMDVQKEMTNINNSLHVLGNCVSALIETNRKHIPYRDSVLTRLLQDALGGSGRTILIATVRTDNEYKEETYSTLQFASRASKIKVSLRPNISIDEKVALVEAQKQIKQLRNKLMLAQKRGGNSISAPCMLCAEYEGKIKEMNASLQLLQQENIELRALLPVEVDGRFSFHQQGVNNGRDLQRSQSLLEVSLTGGSSDRGKADNSKNSTIADKSNALSTATGFPTEISQSVLGGVENIANESKKISGESRVGDPPSTNSLALVMSNDGIHPLGRQSVASNTVLSHQQKHTAVSPANEQHGLGTYIHNAPGVTERYVVESPNSSADRPSYSKEYENDRRTAETKNINTTGTQGLTANQPFTDGKGVSESFASVTSLSDSYFPKGSATEVAPSKSNQKESPVHTSLATNYGGEDLCRKHGLDQCVLCQLFSEKQSLMSANVGSSSAVLSPLRHSVRSSAIDTAQASTTSCNRNFQPSNQVEQRPARNVSKVDAGRSMGSPVKSAVSPALSEYPRSSIDRSNTKSVTNTYEDLLRSVDSILSQSSKISRGPPSSSMPNSAQLQMGSQSNIHLMGNNSHYNSQTADFISTNNSNSFTGVGRGSTQNPSDLTNLSQRQLSNNLTSTTGYDRGNYDHTVNKISIGTNRYDNRNSNTRLVGSCATHGVLDCLLCSLKRGNADRPTVIVEPLSFGGGNNTLIAQSSQNANISNLDARYGSYSNGILDDTNSLVSPSIGNFNMAGSIDTPYANRYYGNLVNGLAANGSVSSIDSQHSAYYMGDTTNVQSHSSQLDSLSIEKERGRKKNNEDSAGLSTTMTYSQRRYPPLPSGNQTLSAHSLNDSKEYFSIGNNHNNKLDQSFKGQKEHDSSFQHDTTFGNSVGEDPTAIVKRPNQYSNSDGIHLTDHAANGDGDYDHNEAGVDEQQGEFDGRAPQKKKTKGKKKILSRSSSRSKGRGKGPHVAGAGASAVQALHNSRHHNFHQNDEADSVLSYVSGNHRRDQGDEALEQPIYPRSSSSPLPLNHRSIPISKFNKPYYEQPHLHDRVAHVDDEEELEETAAGHAALGVGARKVKKKKKAEKRSAPANVYDPQGKAGPLPVLRKNK